MSDWLHVNGMIRIDGLPRLSAHEYTVHRIMRLLGPMYLPYFHVLEKETTIPIPPTQARYTVSMTNECTLPTGSEGSLQYRVIEYDTGLPWVSIPFWGDLRDVESDGEIVKWFTQLCQLIDGQSGFIRDSVMLTQVNGGQPCCYITRRHAETAHIYIEQHG